MDLFDELLGKGHHHAPRHHNHRGDHGHGDHHGWGDHRPPPAPDGQLISHGTQLLTQAMGNKALMALLALLAIVLLLVAVAVLVYLLPLVPKLLGLAGENGVKTVLDQVAPVLNKVWNAAGK